MCASEYIQKYNTQKTKKKKPTLNKVLKSKQIPENWHEAKIVVLCKTGDIDYNKDFDIVEHFAIFEALKKTI